MLLEMVYIIITLKKDGRTLGLFNSEVKSGLEIIYIYYIKNNKYNLFKYYFCTYRKIQIKLNTKT